MAATRSALTFAVDLPGGQDRLRQVIIHVAKRCAAANRFGLIKLNKIIWRADFESFASRAVPVTGCSYQRLQFGPVARAMLALHSEMVRAGLISVERHEFGDGIVEQRTVPHVEPSLHQFSETDLDFVEQSIRYYWDKTGMEASDDSHGVAWSTRANGDPMPYETAYLSDAKLGGEQRRRLEDLAYQRGWVSE